MADIVTPDEARELKQDALDSLAASVDDWDVALVRQAVLHFGRGGVLFSANTYRNVLPESARKHISGAMRSLLNSELIAFVGGMEPSTSGPTKGHRIQQYRLTPKGERMARAQLELLRGAA